MRYAEFLPSPALEPFVRCFWILEGDGAADAAAVQRIVPDGCAELIVQYWQLPSEAGGSAPVGQPRSLLAGQLTQALRLSFPQHFGTLGVRFHPFGLYAWSGEPATATADRRVALEQWCGAGARELEERVLEAGGDEQRVRAAEEWLATTLLNRVARSGRARSDIDAPIARAVRQIEATNGRIAVGSIAQILDLGVRQFERRFETNVGVGPKQFSSIVRFRRLFERVERGASLAQIAVASGYFDQAHLCRDFRRYASCAPSAYLRQESDLERCFTRSFETPAD